MVKKKAKLHKKAMKTKQWDSFLEHQRKCRKAFRQAEWKYVNEKIQSGLEENNSKPFWKYIKSKKSDNLGVSPLRSKGKLHSDDKEIAEILKKQFSSASTINKPSSETMPPVKLNISKSLTHITVDPKGVEKLLTDIKPHKANGPDEIPNLVLKTCATALAPGISLLFQKSLDSGVLPKDWTDANITPVFKKGDRHAAENYRPVSLTSVLAKTLEHIVCHALHKHFDEHDILTNLNHGFRKGHSCTTQLTITVDHIAQYIQKGFQIVIGVLDFTKAFDTVPHDRLPHKLHCYGVRGELHTWIQSFLCKRKMRVLVNGEASAEATVDSGVPQGTVLGPLLFLVHINDLPDRVSSSVRLFADDCLLYRPVSSPEDAAALQKDLNALECWSADWGMQFNAKKCYILTVNNKGFNYFYQLNNHILQNVTNNPYLGLLLSDSLTWSNHINTICKKASSTLGLLRRNLGQCTTSCRRTAYIALVKSMMEYS